ncbi:ribosomal protein L9 domain protein, partial [Teladorsagia circumcincta]
HTKHVGSPSGVCPDPTPPGRVQRNPEELPNLMKLEEVEGIGHQFDVVDVDRKLARPDLLPTRKAVYASPFDLQYYAKMKEEMAGELVKGVLIPYEYICVGRDLQALVVPIKVSMDNKWTIDKQIIKTSLRQMGVDMLDDSIHLDDVSIKEECSVQESQVTDALRDLSLSPAKRSSKKVYSEPSLVPRLLKNAFAYRLFIIGFLRIVTPSTIRCLGIPSYSLHNIRPEVLHFMATRRYFAVSSSRKSSARANSGVIPIGDDFLAKMTAEGFYIGAPNMITIGGLKSFIK